MFFSIIKIMLPMLFAFGLGFAAKRSPLRHTLGRCVRAFNWLVSHVLLPLVIFQAFFTVQFRREALACSIAFFLVMLTSFAVGFLINRCRFARNPAFPFLMASYEGGLLGYPLSALLYPAGMAYFALFDLGQMIFSYFVFIPAMQILYNKKANFREIIKSVLLNPILDAMFLGLLAAKLGLHTLLAASSLEEVYTRGMQILSTVMTYGLLFMIGFDFRLSLSSASRSIFAAVCRTSVLLLSGAIASLILYRFIPFQKSYLLVMLLGCTLPSPLCLTAVNDFGENADYINNVIPYSTLLTFLLFPLFVYFSVS